LNSHLWWDKIMNLEKIKGGVEDIISFPYCCSGGSYKLNNWPLKGQV
jgi:hypothetical protein